MLGRLGLLMTGEDGGIQEISINISGSVAFIRFDRVFFHDNNISMLRLLHIHKVQMSRYPFILLKVRSEPVYKRFSHVGKVFVELL